MAQGQAKTLRERRAEALGLPVQRDAEGTKSIARAAADEGLPATPTSPLGAQTTLPNITPSQAKMAGTPAAMTGALGGVSAPVEATPTAPPGPATSPGGNPPETLTARLRQRGVEATAPKASQQDIDNHYRIEEAKATAGAFGESAERLIQSYVPAAAAPTQTVDTAAAQAAGLNTADPKIAAALEEFAKSSHDAQAVYKLESTVGQKGVATKVLKGTDAAAAVTAATPDAGKLQLNADTLRRLGISAERAASLFPPGTNLATKTIDDVRAAAAEMAHRGESEMEGLRHAVLDPAAGHHERNAAAQELLARGGIVQANEADTQALERTVDEGMRVEIGDKSYTVADLLDDKQMSGLIDRLVREPPDSPFHAEMEAKFPGLVKFVGTHQAALSQAASALQDTQKQVVDLQQKAQQTYHTLTSSGLTEDTLNNLLTPGVVKHLADPYSIKAPDAKTLPPIAQLLLDSTNANQPGFVKRLSGLPVDLVKELGKLSAEQLKDLGIVDGGGKWDSFIAARGRHDALEDTTKSTEERLAAAFGGDFSFAKAQTWLDNARMLSRTTGDDHVLNELEQVFDVNHDGKIDDQAAVLSHTEKKLGGKDKTTIGQFLGGRGKGASAWEDFAKIGELSKGQQYAAMVAETRDHGDQDTALDAALKQPVDGPARNLTYETVGPEGKGMWQHLDSAGKQKLNALLKSNSQVNVAKEMDSQKLPTGAPSRIPWEAMPNAYQDANGVAPKNHFKAAAEMSDDDLERTSETLITLGNKGFQGADTPDHPKAEWEGVMQRMAQMVAIAAALREFKRRGIPGSDAKRSIGQWLADPLKLAEMLPDGRVKDAVKFSQNNLGSIPTDAVIDSVPGLESGRERGSAGGQGGAGSGVVGYGPDGAPVYAIDTEGAAAPVYVGGEPGIAAPSRADAGRAGIVIPDEVAPAPARKKGTPAPKRAGGRDANPG